MKATLVVPKNPLAKKFIQYFFFIENKDIGCSKSFVCYPNTNYCLGIHKGNKVEKCSDSNFTVLPHNNFHSYLSGIYQKPMNVDYSGIFSGLWINFEPMGLEMLSGEKVSENLFIQDAIESVLPQKWSQIYDLAFCDSNPYACASKLENFFLTSLSTKNSFEYIPFNEIHANHVDDLKKVYYKSYSSINRLYKNSLNVSPKEFLNILRFRRSIKNIHSIKRLTDIAYQEGYSDQAHMIREFKKYARLTPKDFRKQSKIIQKQLCLTID